MPRSPATPADTPPLNAGRRSRLPLVLAVLLAVGGGVGWGLVGVEAVDRIAATFAAGAVGCLGWLATDAVIDRRRAGRVGDLDGDRSPAWAEAERTAARRHAERAAALADGVGDPYLSTQRYVGEYFRRAREWGQEIDRRLGGRFPPAAVAAVLAVLAAVVRLTPNRAQSSAFVELGWPAVVGAVAATVAAVEVLARGRRWERVFARWREWATDRETPDLPPPSPAVELEKPPPAPSPQVSKPKADPPPPVWVLKPDPPVVELTAPPQLPKPVLPPPLPSPLERLRNLDLNASPPDDDNDRK